ncbi:MAG TPA: septum formation initiator family protein [Puia sp.]|nr:septum formation initiator family protein [Puia sp.]
MKFLSHIPSWLKNKYVLTSVGFTVWILFFDARDFITSHFREKGELRKLEQSKKYYEQQITTTQHELEQLKSNPALLEKYAREKYLMKRDNEDLFRIHEDNSHPSR